MMNSTGHWVVLYKIGFLGTPKRAYRTAFRTKQKAHEWANRFKQKMYRHFPKENIDVSTLLDNPD
jgi:ribosomal protein L20